MSFPAPRSRDSISEGKQREGVYPHTGVSAGVGGSRNVRVQLGPWPARSRRGARLDRCRRAPPGRRRLGGGPSPSGLPGRELAARGVTVSFSGGGLPAPPSPRSTVRIRHRPRESCLHVGLARPASTSVSGDRGDGPHNARDAGGRHSPGEPCGPPGQPGGSDRPRALGPGNRAPTPPSGKALAYDLGLTSERCEFLGRVPYEAMPTLYRQVDAVVLPSFTESCPMVALEAMACGTPLIAADVGGVSEIVRDGETGWLFPAGDADGLVSCIRAVLDDTVRREPVRARARAWAEANASIDRMAGETFRFYERLVGGEAS